MTKPWKWLLRCFPWGACWNRAHCNRINSPPAKSSKFCWSIIFTLAVQLFWNWCSVQNLKMIGQLREQIWSKEILRDMSFIEVSFIATSPGKNQYLWQTVTKQRDDLIRTDLDSRVTMVTAIDRSCVIETQQCGPHTKLTYQKRCENPIHCLHVCKIQQNFLKWNIQNSLN